jgi:hypothetical protein
LDANCAPRKRRVHHALALRGAPQAPRLHAIVTVVKTVLALFLVFTVQWPAAVLAAFSGMFSMASFRAVDPHASAATIAGIECIALLGVLGLLAIFGLGVNLVDGVQISPVPGVPCIFYYPWDDGDIRCVLAAFSFGSRSFF